MKNKGQINLISIAIAIIIIISVIILIAKGFSFEKLIEFFRR